jgi:hypothetical protein
MNIITEPERNVPVIYEADLCVIGGSCTGVFAAVRAARLGLRVVIIEKQNSFGGVATQGLVNCWHSLMDTEFKREIIAGLTREVITRLKKRDAVKEIPHNRAMGFILNTEELKIELDALVCENKVKPYLHTFFTFPYVKDGQLRGVIVENKSGRGVILGKIFIDATGDGDVAARLGIPFTIRRYSQPPTMCARIYGVEGLDIGELIRKHGEEYGLPNDWGWRGGVVGIPGVTFHAETHVFDVNCVDANDLTKAEIEGRRSVRAYMDIIRKYTDRKPVLVALASHVGIRETRHIHCLYRLTEQDVLNGVSFEDAIGYGSYCVDIHHEDRAGITFRYLDGTELVLENDMKPRKGRWRAETSVNPTFYQIPYRTMVPEQYNSNLLVCGRAIDTDAGAFGAIRVMVNTNQTGEAAGVAAYCALASGVAVSKVDIQKLRKLLAEGGSIIF